MAERHLGRRWFERKLVGWHGLNRRLEVLGLPRQDFFDHGRDRIFLLRE
jgi:hypothetical protein